MKTEIPSLEWGLPFALFGVLLLLIVLIITYLSLKNKIILKKILGQKKS